MVVGDVRDLGRRVDYGPSANPRFHQMATGQVRWMVTYKAERLGMRVAFQDKAHTSQECPHGWHRRKPRGREYPCPVCGFRFPRDGVGAINIRRKYRGLGPVVAVMASPLGRAVAALPVRPRRSRPARKHPRPLGLGGTSTKVFPIEACAAGERPSLGHAASQTLICEGSPLPPCLRPRAQSADCRFRRTRHRDCRRESLPHSDTQQAARAEDRVPGFGGKWPRFLRYCPHLSEPR